MGSPPTESGHQTGEEPQHNVTIAKRFAVSKSEITFADWDSCATYGDCDPHISDRGWGRGQQPVMYVTWNDAKHYVRWLSTMTGKPYRLLSEAEYEYAARGGSQTVYPWGNAIGSGNAGCNGCGGRWDNVQTAPVGSFVANRFGLYDMVGNVNEWVEDCLHVNYQGAPADGSAWIQGGNCGLRIGRGGNFGSLPIGLRSATRYRDPPEFRGSGLGFRVARVLPPKSPQSRSRRMRARHPVYRRWPSSTMYPIVQMLWGERRGQWHHRRSSESTERPMPQLNDLSRSLVILEQDATLIAVIEMGQSSWLVAGIVPGVERSPLKKLVVDESALTFA